MIDAGILLRDYFTTCMSDRYVLFKHNIDSNDNAIRDEVVLPKNLVRDNVISKYNFYYTYSSDNILRMNMIHYLDMLDPSKTARPIIYRYEDKIYRIQLWVEEEMCQTKGNSHEYTEAQISCQVCINTIKEK